MNKKLSTKQCEVKLESGKSLLFYKFSTTYGLKYGKTLLDIAAPLLGGTLDGVKNDDLFNNNPRNFTNLALTLCEQLDKVNVVDLVVELTEHIYIDGNPVDFDEYFSDNYAELVEILEIVIRENFSSFFTGKGISHRFMATVKEMLGEDKEQ